jgi:hypothetical protein
VRQKACKPQYIRYRAVVLEAPAAAGLFGAAEAHV